MTTQQYIGARYVPIFGRKGEDSIEWDNSKSYEPLTVVLHEGNSFTSRQYVPTGIDISNEVYWAETGNFNAQVEQYRQEALHAKNTADNAKNTADTAITLANKHAEYFDNLGINSDSSASEMKTHVDSAVENSDNSIAYFREMKINSIEAASINYRANAMDIRKLGAIENNESIDCGALINAYLSANPNASVYIPSGIWYTKSTVSINGESTIWCDGFLKLATEFELTDDTIVKLHGSDSEVSSTMCKSKTIKVNVDGGGKPVNGISVQGYFASTFDLTANGCMKTCIKTISRNIENFFNVHFYGTEEEFAEVGFQIAGGDNDNRADVIGRNATIGVDNHSSYWFFGYVHVWGCAEGVKLYPTTSNIINNFYPDYTLTALTCTDTPSAIVKIDNIQSILPKGYYLMGDNTNNKVVLIANQVYIPDGYAQMFKGSPVGILGNIQINDFNNKVIAISPADLQTFTTTQQFIDKYGYIASDEIIAGITVKWPAASEDGSYNYDTFKNTQAGANLLALKYHISRNEEYLWGMSTLYVTKRLLRDPAYPQTILWEILQNDMPKYYMSSKVGVVQNNMVLKTLKLTATSSGPMPIG